MTSLPKPEPEDKPFIRTCPNCKRRLEFINGSNNVYRCVVCNRYFEIKMKKEK